ncbi:ATP-dependent DNA helicase [Clostridium algidicarnis]|uniref:ATP-dependent DNA helicase n=1 Tax=Clostridium algidicarnis TaxID=37659 RepID=UPI00068FDE29|nr:ATP-dependent DNA helicase [Clostridium algidicarnis]
MIKEEEKTYFPENNMSKISVRELVEFVLRRGSIDSGFISSKRAQQGTMIHKKLQKIKEEAYSKREGFEYKKEAFLSHKTFYKDLTILVEGRADGLLINENQSEIGNGQEKVDITIEEIKSTTRDLSLIDIDYNELHWAQAKCYAYMFLMENEKERELSGKKASVELIYYNVDTDDTKTFLKRFNIKELEDFFLELIKGYHKFAMFTLEWKSLRDSSIELISFPFKGYRKGQRELAVAVYGTIRDGKKIFAKAPTGIGKTISTIFPAVKALGKGHLSKIFYLTAKTPTRIVAEDTFGKLRKNGLKLKNITITAKDKICFTEEKICTKSECIYADGHFDRVNEALFDMLENEDNLNRENIEVYAKKHRVCPFEFSLDLSLFCDAIICDYNYVFDPSASLKRFFDKDQKKGKEGYLLLIDEAHNMVERSREMFSSEIIKSKVLIGKKIIKGKSNGIYKALNSINSYLINLRHELEDKKGRFIVEKTPPEELYPLLKNFMKESEEYLIKNKNTEGFAEILELYFNFNSFLNIGENYNKDYVTYWGLENGDFKLKMFCVDPSRSINNVMEIVTSTVFFSATLDPMDYFKDLLGGDSKDYVIRLDSPFPKENLEVLLVNNVSTKYTKREDSYEVIANYIYTLGNSKKGNYMIFFPSYKYMNSVLECYKELHGDNIKETVDEDNATVHENNETMDKANKTIDIIVQETSMTEEKREEFLNEFKEERENTLLAFTVLGGVFGESIDLVGNKLTGALIVGVGLPMVGTERDIIKDYYDANNNKGFEYAYIYPGMNKVKQAAGRVIRTENDKGILILIDERYNYKSYQSLLPKEWLPYNRIMNPKELENTIK